MNKQNMPVRSGQHYTITITGLGHSGEGVGRCQDFTVFVPGALPGETVEARIGQVKKNYAKGELKKILEPSPERVQPPCPIYKDCGGCQLQHLAYSAQLRWKRQQVVDALKRIGKLDVEVKEVLGAENPWHYRNKMQFPAGQGKNGLIVGCYRQGTHIIVPAVDCLIQSQGNNAVATAVCDAASELGILAYDEQSGEGILRHVMGRTSAATGEIMAVLVTATATIPRQQELIQNLRGKLPEMVSLIQNINPQKTNIILGQKTRTLWGQDYITDNLGKLRFRISPLSFFQVNTNQALHLYEEVRRQAQLTGQETLLDLYCGTGTITLFLAEQAAKAYGVEIVAPAIVDAKRNAQDNKIGNVEFFTGDAVKILPQLYQKGIRPDVLVTDPPRAGCDPAVLDIMAQMHPKRIIYVSCNPASLARDLAILQEKGYQAQYVQPVDMFAGTGHVETVVLMSRVK